MLLNTREVAALLRVHPKHVYRLLRRGLPGRRVGGEWRFVQEEVLSWGSASGVAVTVERSADAARVVAANEDLVVDVLLDTIGGSRGPLLGRVPADSAAGVELLRRRAVTVAGFHGGEPPAIAGMRVAALHLFDRELGLVYQRRQGAPALADLARLRFASRPPTAGSRVHLDEALRRQGLDRRRFANAMTLGSPRDVACAVASGAADAGIATRAWASRLGLDFSALVIERYALLIDAAHLGDPAIVRLCEVAQGPAFADRVRAIPGCDPGGAGALTFLGGG